MLQDTQVIDSIPSVFAAASESRPRDHDREIDPTAPFRDLESMIHDTVLMARLMAMSVMENQSVPGVVMFSVLEVERRIERLEDAYQKAYRRSLGENPGRRAPRRRT